MCLNRVQPKIFVVVGVLKCGQFQPTKTLNIILFITNSDVSLRHGISVRPPVGWATEITASWSWNKACVAASSA